MILIFTCRQDRRAPWSCCRRHTGGPDQYKMSINRELTNQRPAFCLFVCYHLNGDTLDKPQAHEHRQPLDKVETNPNEALEEARIRTRFWMFNCELHSRISSWYVHWYFFSDFPYRFSISLQSQHQTLLAIGSNLCCLIIYYLQHDWANNKTFSHLQCTGVQAMCAPALPDCRGRAAWPTCAQVCLRGRRR